MADIPGLATTNAPSAMKTSNASSSATRTRSNNRIGLFTLPAEIRNEIYRLSCEREYQSRIERACYPFKDIRLDVMAAPRRVCRQIRQEYTAICLSKDTLQLRHEFFHINGVMVTIDRNHYLHWFQVTKEVLEVLDEQLVRSLKSFELSIYDMTLLIEFGSG